MHPNLLAAVAVVLTLVPGSVAGMYGKDSAVLEVTGKNYDRLINRSNYTSIVEFYAPWCGHCKALKNDYTKAAASLKGLANVAAIDCTDTDNQPLCSAMGIAGYPTLKIVRPGKKTSHPVTEDYQGQRKAKAIVDAVLPKINNHVTKVTDKDVDAFLAADGPRALLFSDKGTVSPLLKAIAIDFVGALPIGQVRNKEAATVAQYGIETFPSLLVFPGAGAPPITYDGELKKEPMVAFLSQFAVPNPPAAAAPKPKPKGNTKPNKAKAADEETTSTPTTSSPTAQQTAPVIVESALPLPTIHTADKLAKSCLGDRASTCVLVFVADTVDADAPAAKAEQATLDALAELTHKYAQSKRPLFPFYVVPAHNTAAAGVLQSLDLSMPGEGVVHIVAVNARRGWWRQLAPGEGVSHDAIESWVDAIRMGQGAKNKLPDNFVAAVEAVATTETDAEAEAPKTETVETHGAEVTETETVKADAADTTAAEAASEEVKHEEL